jgi:hypothetical protein
MLKNFNTNKEALVDETKWPKQVECSITRELQQAQWLCWTINGEYFLKIATIYLNVNGYGFWALKIWE